MSTDYSHNNNAVSAALNSSYQGNITSGSGYQLSSGMTYQVPKTWSYRETKTGASVCYVIATWSGQRRAGNNIFHKNPIFYLKKHLEQLEKVEHNLDLIILCNPINPTEPRVYTNYISNLPEKIGAVPVKVIHRENIGQSYGSYSDAFIQNPTFDYYIFIEDDYAPVLDNFDEILIQMFEASPKCGYLCSYAHNKPPEGPHAAISNGISNQATLQSIVKSEGCLPYAKNITKSRGYASEPQLEFSRGFMRTGTKIYDYLSYFNSPFNEAGKFVVYGSSQLPTLFYPVQFLK